MKIAVIGTGNVGGALATNLAKAGHQIFLGVKDTQDFKGKSLLENPNTTAHLVAESAENAEVIIVAVWPQAVLSIVEQIKDFAKGKILIDAMNQLGPKPKGFEHSFEAFRNLLPETEVVKCFNTTGAENLTDPVYNGEAINMFVAGDSEKGKEVAKQLSTDVGFSPCLDFGGDETVPMLEGFAMVWHHLAMNQEYGRNIAFKFLQR